MKIIFLIGTKGQLIKMAPIINIFNKKNIDFNFINAAQHGKIFNDIITAFNLPKPSLNLMNRKKDVLNPLEELNWISKTLINSLFKNKECFKNSIILVHGDASPAILGLFISKLTKSKLAHIEAGLRSYDFFNPFPEEIIRYFVDRYADFLYAPSDYAVNNLKKMKTKGKIINTIENTVLDSVRYSIKDYNYDVPKKLKNNVIFTVHRYETLKSKIKIKIILDIMNKISSTYGLTFVMHNTTRHYLTKYNLLDEIPKNANVIPLQIYPRFIKIINESRFVVTDGGGLQEETSYLGKPCLVLRNLTERKQGLSKNVKISKFDASIINDFIQNYQEYEKKSIIDNAVYPSKKIYESIKDICQL